MYVSQHQPNSSLRYKSKFCFDLGSVKYLKADTTGFYIVAENGELKYIIPDRIDIYTMFDESNFTILDETNGMLRGEF